MDETPTLTVRFEGAPLGPVAHPVTEALRLPYSIGAHRLLREILSDVTGVPLPPEPPVRHGPVQQPHVPPMWRKSLPPSERRRIVLEALKRGPVTQTDVPEIDSWQLPTAVRQLRQMGHVIQNVSPRQRAARYVLHKQETPSDPPAPE